MGRDGYDFLCMPLLPLMAKELDVLDSSGDEKPVAMEPHSRWLAKEHRLMAY